MDRFDRAAHEELFVTARVGTLAGTVALAAALASCSSLPVTHPGDLATSCFAIAHRDSPRSSWYRGAPGRGLVRNLADEEAPGTTHSHGTTFEHTHTDVTGENADGTLSLRRSGSAADLPVVAGGLCGVTTFRDGKDTLTLAPTSPMRRT